jgi:hypothetical protein
MNSFFDTLSKIRSLVFLAALVILFNVLIPRFLPKDHALDLQFAYSTDQVFYSLNQLDGKERNLYRIGLLALDMPYLISYALLLSGILIRLWKRKVFVLIPFFIALADLFENLIILRLLGIFPKENALFAVMASVFSTTKWVMVGIVLVTVIAGVINWKFSGRDVSVKSPKVKI